MKEAYQKLYDNIRENYYLFFVMNENNRGLTKRERFNLFTDELLKSCCDTSSRIRTSKLLMPNRQTIYRGVGLPAKNYIKLLKDQSYTFHRYGVIGYGNYFSFNKNTALSYGFDESKNLIKASLDKDTNIVNYDNLVKCFDFDFLKELKENRNILDPKVIDFISQYKHKEVFLSALASVTDQDAIETDYGNVICVVNPKKVTYLDR